MAVRDIPPNRRSITGHVPSKKKPGMVAFESTLERDLILLLEFDSLVRTVSEQPVRICFEHNGKSQIYTPDLYITYNDPASRLPMFIEVKYRRDLFEHWSELHIRLRAGARYARRKRSTFKILTEVEIRTARLHSVTWLMPYRSAQVSHNEVDEIIKTLELHGTLTADQILYHLRDSANSRESLLATLWHLIAIGTLETDLDCEITMSSPIWMANRADSR
jgi:hypothetical protein